VLFIVLSFSGPVSAQYSNASLNGPWLGVNFEPDMYLIFDGNGNINEMGSFYNHETVINLGTYSVTSSGYLSGNIKIDNQNFALTGQFITPDSIDMGDRIHSLLKIPNAGALAGSWSGGIVSSNYENFNISVNSSGKITGPNTWLAHIFERNGKVVGFFDTKDGSNCWHQFQLVNCTYKNNRIAGIAASECKDNQGQSIVLTRISNKTISAVAGGLSSALTPNEKSGITSLKVTGTIDARDFKTMRDDIPQLTEIDLSGATIVAYSGLEGTTDAQTIINYPANAIPAHAFYNVTSKEGKKDLSTFIFPSGITSVGRLAFQNCTSLTSVSIPPFVTSLGVQAFYNCTDLVKVSIEPPSSLTAIGKYAFGFCSKLISVTIPKSVSSIGIVAFLGSIASVNVDADNLYFSSLNGALYNKQKTSLIYVPNYVNGDYDIPPSVTRIAVDAFYNCLGLSSITIPSSVKTIQDWAFENCTFLTSISIPSSVDSIGSYAFYNCKRLLSIFANSPIPVNLSASDSVFNHVDKNMCSLFVPTGTIGAYKVANKWKDFSRILEFSNAQTKVDLIQMNGLKVYPNPSDGIVKIEGLNTNHKNEIAIYTIGGKLIRKKICSSATEMMNISDRVAGLYLLFINGKAIKILKN